MSEKSLRERLVGAWALTSYVERDVETGVENHPFGEHPLGFVLYTPDGYVSAQLQRPGRPPFADGDLLRATPKEYAAAGSSYIGYSGRFFIDEGKKKLEVEQKTLRSKLAQHAPQIAKDIASRVLGREIA